MLKGMVSSISAGLSSGGTVEGDITITEDLVVKGDLKVEGGGSFAFDEIIEGTQVIEKTDTEAFLVRKASDGGDVFVVDTTNNSAILPLNASSVSNKLKFTGDGTGEIYRNSYDMHYISSINHYFTGSTGLVLRTSDDARKIFLSHSSGTKQLYANISDFNILAGHSGAFGFLTAGSTSTFKAIESVHTDNNTSGLKLNYKTGGTDTTAMTITSAGDVGIGTTAPADYNAVANKLVVADSGNSGITIASGTSNYGALYFADGTSGTAEYMGGVEYYHNDNVMKIWANGSTAGLTLDANSKISLSNNDDGTSNTVFGNGIGTIDTGSNYNVFIGHEVASDGTLADATKNVIIGYQAGEDLTTADSNVAIGYQSLKQATTGGFNIGIGSNSLDALVDGSSNVGIGTSALGAVTSGVGNIAMGENSGATIQTESNNTYIGHNSGRNIDDGASNSALGYQSMLGASTGNNALNNVAIGYQSLKSITTGDNNTCVGYQAGDAVTTTSNNTAVGAGSFSSANGTETGDVAIGTSSMGSVDNDASDYCVAIGHNALNGGSGSVANSVAIGAYALDGTGSIGGTQNVAIGYEVMSGAVANNPPFWNVAIGHQAMGAGAMDGATSNVVIGYQSGRDITTGDYNLLLGHTAGTDITTGLNNIALGYRALYVATTTSKTVCIGYQAGDAINSTDADGTVAIGYSAGTSITDGQQNTFVGYQAGEQNDTGNWNTAVGYTAYDDATGAMDSNTVVGAIAGGFANASSDNNVVIGAWALRNGTGAISENVVIGDEACDGLGTNNPIMQKCTFVGRRSGSGTWGSNAVQYNTAIGYNTMPGALDGATHNVTLGYSTLGSLTTGDSNIALGSFSLNDLVSGSNNIAIGHSSGENATGSNSLSIGSSASYNLTSGANQVSIGHEAGMALTTAGNSTFIGYQAGKTIEAGNNVAIGDRAFANTDADANAKASTKNVAIGNLAMGGAINNTVTGAVAIGYYALGSATCGTSASYGVYIGHHANINNGGGQNIAIGGYALEDADGTETGNIAIGVSCMDNVNNDSSDFNTVIGNYAVRGGTGEYSENTAMGYEVHDGVGNQLVSREVMIGRGTGGGTIAGSCVGSVAVGYQALSANNRDSNYNIAIGQYAGNAITTGGNNICIGLDTDPSAADGTNQIVIGSSTTGLGDNYAVIGNADITRLYVASDGAGVLYANGTIQTSDKRLKENIEDTDLGLDFINKLRPVKYNYIKDKHDGKTKYGIIAQEVQEVLKESNNEDFAGIKDSDEYLGADYNQFIAPLMKAVQELSAEIDKLKKQLEDK